MPRLARKHVANCDVPSQARMPELNGYNVDEVTLEELQDHYSKEHFTITEYTAFCLERIRRLNSYLEAVIELNPEALEHARRLDQVSAAQQQLGSLHGIPVLVKDNIATDDLLQTTAGSWALLGSIVAKDSHVITRLRQAGAIIIGHANMSEWASVRSKVYSTGYSPRGGQVRNPFNLRMSPFGSSSGSAVAVSANLVPLALGTETDTSIIGPASINGVVGIKPTVGVTSRSGVIPISHNMDSVGAFGRTVHDAVVGLETISDEDDVDIATKSATRPGKGSYLRSISGHEVLKGARFGLPIERCWQLCKPDHREIATKVLNAMKDAGATIVDTDLPSIEERVGPEGGWDWERGDPDKSEWTVAKVDAYNGLNTYVRGLKESPIRSVEEIVKYNQDNNGTEGAYPDNLPAFPNGQDNLLEIQEYQGKEDDVYRRALQHIRSQTREKGIDAALSYQDADGGGRTQLDALLFCDRHGIGQQYAAQAGYPIICIPIGVDNTGMPVSLSIQHSAWKEEELIKWASAIEDLWNMKNGWRTTPSYKNFLAKNIPIEKI